MREGAEVNIKTDKRYTALYVAAEAGYELVVRLLLEKDAEINFRRPNGYTALYISASAGHESVVQLLLERGGRSQRQNKL